MMKLRSRLYYYVLAGLVGFFGIFLTSQLFSTDYQAYAEDDTPIRSYGEEFFVTIHDDHATLTVKTRSTTVRAILEESGITVAETDLIEPSLDTVIDTDYNINIHRSRPAIVVDGIDRRYVMTASYDPKEIALAAGLTVYDGDTFTTEFNSNFLEAGAVTTYKVERNGGRTITITEPIPYTTEKKYDYNLAMGETYLERAGEDGIKTSVYEVKFSDNIETERSLLSEDITREPVSEIVVIGAKKSIPPEREQCAGWAREAGVSEDDLSAALDLIYHESGCRIDATNLSSGAYGIPQALPGEKMAAFGDDWQLNPVTQIKWMIHYVTNRYGGWQPAMNWWWEHGWY